MARQMEIKGTERKRNVALSNAAEAYKKVRDAAIRASSKASDEKTTLLELCEKHLKSFTETAEGEYVYTDPEAQIELRYTKRDNVKLRTLSGDDGESVEAE